MIPCGFCSKRFHAKYKSQIFCSLICSNRQHLNNKNTKIQLPLKYNRDLAELFGILLGDGSVTKYFAKIYLNRIVDFDYAPYVKHLAKQQFPGASVTSVTRVENGTIEIQISSIDVCEYLRKIGFDAKQRYIPEWISEDTQFMKATLRGIFDTEGSVGMKYFHGKHGKYLYKQLTVTNKNENILRFLENSLIRLKFKPTKNSQKNIYLSNKNDIMRYLDEVGSSNPKIVKKIEVKNVKGFVYGGVG